MQQSAKLIQIVGRHVLLIPYSSKHVSKYCEWMKDPWIKEMTASDDISLENAHSVQQADSK
jgi:hypothetical protein